MLWKFKNNKNTTEIAKKICNVYGQGVINDHQVQNWLSKFCSDDMSLRDELRSGCFKRIGGMQSAKVLKN